MVDSVSFLFLFLLVSDRKLAAATVIIDRLLFYDFLQRRITIQWHNRYVILPTVTQEWCNKFWSANLVFFYDLPTTIRRFYRCIVCLMFFDETLPRQGRKVMGITLINARQKHWSEIKTSSTCSGNSLLPYRIMEVCIERQKELKNVKNFSNLQMQKDFNAYCHHLANVARKNIPVTFFKIAFKLFCMIQISGIGR